MIERIFSGCVTRGRSKQNVQNGQNARMSYTDFVWFLLAEEDKNHPTAIEYWFRCMDIDGDGILSMYELEYFYEEQQHRMEQLGIETLPFEDCLCQVKTLCASIIFCARIIYIFHQFSDARYDKTSKARLHHTHRFETLQNDSDFLRHILQPGKIHGA